MPTKSVIDLKELSREFRPALMAFFLRRVHDHAEAEDLTQEVFARLANAAHGSLQSGSAYMFQIASNLLRDRHRREQVRQNYMARHGWEDFPAVETLDPHRVATGRDSIAALCAALDKLPSRTQSIFILYRLENIPKPVIADSLGLTVSAVEKHLTKAMAYLSARLGDEK